MQWYKGSWIWMNFGGIIRKYVFMKLMKEKILMMVNMGKDYKCACHN